MDGRTVDVLVTSAIWIAVVIAVRWTLRRGYALYEARAVKGSPQGAAQRRTTFEMLQRVIVVFVASIGVWNVLSIFPQTETIGKALLASSAVLAVFVGLAFNTPLSNLGSGMLVAFSQPLRLGDRVTVGDHTGYVEELTVLYTTLRADDDRRVYIPNSQLTSVPIVNRTVMDPRRAVSAVFPVPLAVSLDEVRSTLLATAAGVPETIDEPRVLVTGIEGGSAWVTVRVFTPLDADVAAVESQLRTSGLGALASAGLLAT
ncbi:MAG: mechanosensitive ion channel family protein [Gaiella sp.]